MSPAPWCLKNTVADFAQAWQRFFHAPGDGRVAALVRIAYAAVVLVHFAVLYPDLDLWYTESGLLPLENSRQMVSPHAWSLLAMLPGTSQIVHACFWIAVSHAALLLIGLLPRLNALALFVWIVSFQMRNDVINDGEDCLMRMLCFFMIWLPSGHCWSADALIRRAYGGRQASQFTDQQPSENTHPWYEVPGWGLRLFQFEMAAMLFSSGLMKLAGKPWLDGTAIYYVSRLDDHFGRFPVPAWVFDSPWAVALMTWSVLLAELVAPLLIWFRETRRPCLLVLVAFHLANEWTMNLFLFHWLMLAGWLSFVDLRPNRSKP